jgi:acyl carrier protein
MNTNPQSTIEGTLLNYLMEECLPRNCGTQLHYHQNLFETGIVDSAGLISFINFIEREFGLTVPDEDLLPENFVSISAIANYIRAHQQVQNAPREEMRRVGS